MRTISFSNYHPQNRSGNRANGLKNVAMTECVIITTARCAEFEMTGKAISARIAEQGWCRGMSGLISRKALCEYALNQKNGSVTPNDIMRFPSAEPERTAGHWVKADSAQYFRKHYPTYTCSLCNFKKNGRWNYCPNCGADMR